jgi:hypothetical protein
MPSDMAVPPNCGLRTNSTIQSESSELTLLRLENQQLRELIIQLSEIVFKKLMDTKRPRSDGAPIAGLRPTLCAPNWESPSAPSFWLSCTHIL